MAKDDKKASAGITGRGVGPVEETYVEVLAENLSTYHKGDVTSDPAIVALLGDGTGRVRLAPKPVKPAPTAGLIEGRIVHYVLDDGPHASETRPAIVVKVWDKDSGCVNVNIFTDGENDGDARTWATSVLYSEEYEPRTWHWIPKA